MALLGLLSFGLKLFVLTGLASGSPRIILAF